MNVRCAWMGIFLAQVLLAGSLPQTLFSQDTVQAPNPAAGTAGLRLGRMTVSGSLRTRAEAWDWFPGGADNSYGFSGSLLRLGLTGGNNRYDWQIEFALPVLLGLPSGSVAPGPQSQFGFGATYFAANSGNRNAALPFLKRGSLRLQGLGAGNHQSLQFGRLEFTEGAEITPPNGVLAALKGSRIPQRLIGNFGFTHVGRSFDGVQYVFDDNRTNVTLFGGRPTRGVFQVDGWGQLRINLFYGAVTREYTGRRNAAEWRLFGIGYSDYRNGVVKSDNRPPVQLQADQARIHLATAGGHFLQVVETSAGPLDVLLWGALQTGSWGTLRQRAGAVAIEAGWQPAVLPQVHPWIRAGFDYGSGDDNPDDGTHGSFFQLLPTPRGYARFPFFNLMNIRDVFGEVLLRPSGDFTLHADVHSLHLASRNDLWYVGGGAFQPWTFGFLGRPSGGNSGLALLYGVSVDYHLGPRASLSVYYGRANGRSVIESVYPDGADASFGLVELAYRF